MGETPSTSRLGRNWELARTQLDALRRRRNHAETTLANATNELGKRIDPGDQGFGEVVSLWVAIERGEVLLQSIKDGDGCYRVREREKGNPLLPLEPPCVEMED